MGGRDFSIAEIERFEPGTHEEESHDHTQISTKNP